MKSIKTAANIFIIFRIQHVGYIFIIHINFIKFEFNKVIYIYDFILY